MMHLRGRGIAVALQQAVTVEPLLELPQRLPQLLDRVEHLPPQELLLEDRCSLRIRMNRSATPLPSGARVKLGLDSMLKNRSSRWKV